MQNLQHPLGIAEPRLLGPAVAQHLQIDALGLCPDTVHRLDPLRQLRGQELEPFQRHPPAFDLGQIKDVIQDRQQMRARLLNGLQHGLLFRCRQRRSEHIGHAENAVQRRPDLVAHVGQKHRFRPVAGLGTLHCGAKICLGGDGFRDVHY